jgi:hypothetical protein
MNLSPSTEKGKFSPPSSANAAYGGVPQEDLPEILKPAGDQDVNAEARRTLSGYILNIFDDNKMLRQSNGIEEELAKRLRQMNGVYDPEDEAKLIANNHPKVYINISAHKQRTLVAWLTEFFTDSEKNFYLKPTPIPEMSDEIVQKAVQKTMQDWMEETMQTGQPPPPEAVQEYASLLRERMFAEVSQDAKERAAKMERRLKDDMIEAKWRKPFDSFISLIATYGTAGLRSPVVRLCKRPSYEKSDFGMKVVDKMRLLRECDEISPWDMFPSDGATDAQEGDFCIRVRYSAKDLRAMSKLPSYFEDNINYILDMYGSTGLRVEVSSDNERETLEKKGYSAQRKTKIIEGVEFWGQVSGELLIGMGITRTPEKTPIDSMEWYEVNAILVDTKVIYCRVIDNDMERPIDVAGVYRIPGSFWHQSPLYVMDHIQRLCNAAARNLVVNMGFASGPQSYMDDVSRLHPMDDGKARPNKTWAFMNNGANSNRPISFFSIPSISDELLKIFEFYMRLADEITGIPAFANGTDAAVGAARTASGLNMLFGAANRGIKRIVANMDDVVKSAITRLYWWHMRYSQDDSIKGDVNIEVCGLRQFTMREQLAQKHLSLLQAMGQDPRMAQLQSPEQLARMLREVATGFELDPDSLAPSDEELQKRIADAKEKAEAEMAMQAEAMKMQMQQQQGAQQQQAQPQQQGMPQ